MGFIVSIIKHLLKLILFVVVFIAIIALIPNLPPYASFSKIVIEPTHPRTGPLEPNTALNNAEKLYKSKLLGPEAFQLYNGEVYTGLATGEIVKLSPEGHVTYVTKIGQPCTGLTQEHICGRPLGFTIDEKNKLMYIADAYHGIWKVDLNTDKKQLLVSPRAEIDGRKPTFFNSVTLGTNGDLYWTDSSSDFQLKDGIYAMITDPTGRLFYYNAAKNESIVLLDGLWFPNGVVVSPDNQFVVVSETNRYKLIKYYINGPKKGKSEILVAGLPGVPDNIRTLPDGSGILVGLYNVFDNKDPLLTKSLSETPILRKFIARLMRLIEIPFEFLYSQYPHIVFEEIVYFIGHFKSLSFLAPHSSGLVQIDWDGNIVASYYSTDGSVSHVSDAIVYNDKLLLGSPHMQDYVAAVPAPPLLKKAFASVKSLPPPKTAQTITKEIPKTKIETKPVESSKQTIEEKKESPKITKPTQESPKTAENSKSTTAKPIEKKPAEPVTSPKPTPPPKQAEPKLTPSNQAESKPTPSPKQAEPKPTPSPKQAEPKPTPSLKQAEPKPTPSSKQAEPKPIPSPKQAEPKPTPPPKQAEQKSNSPKQTETKPNQSSKQTESKPQTNTKQADVKLATSSKQPDIKPVTLPTSAEAKPKVEQNPVSKPVQGQPSDSKTKSTETKNFAQKDSSKSTNDKPVPEHIPIKEEIPSDTVKPNKETLKVIRKGGPTEIPNPNL